LATAASDPLSGTASPNSVDGEYVRPPIPDVVETLVTPGSEPTDYDNNDEFSHIKRLVFGRGDELKGYVLQWVRGKPSEVSLDDVESNAPTGTLCQLRAFYVLNHQDQLSSFEKRIREQDSSPT
jgi:hypothetical protein